MRGPQPWKAVLKSLPRSGDPGSALAKHRRPQSWTSGVPHPPRPGGGVSEARGSARGGGARAQRAPGVPCARAPAPCAPRPARSWSASQAGPSWTGLLQPNAVSPLCLPARVHARDCSLTRLTHLGTGCGPSGAPLPSSLGCPGRTPRLLERPFPVPAFWRRYRLTPGVRGRLARTSSLLQSEPSAYSQASRGNPSLGPSGCAQEIVFQLQNQPRTGLLPAPPGAHPSWSLGTAS